MTGSEAARRDPIDGGDVSVVITLGREPADRVDRLLNAIAAQSEPVSEIVVATGDADTAKLLRDRIADSSIPIEVVDNPGGRRSPGLNLATRAASGSIIVRLDARSRPPVDHVRACADVLRTRPEVAVAGGVQHPVAGAGSTTARGIVRALSNPWMLGLPAYRVAGASGPVDTVYLGAWRRRELLEMGGFAESLDANEDFELCQRFSRSGHIVWLVDGLACDYEARSSLREVAGQYAAFGRSKAAYWRLTGERPNARQAVALAGGVTLVAAAAASLRRPVRLLGLAAAVVGTVAVTDQLANGRARPIERLASVVASCTAAGSWLAGVIIDQYRFVVASRHLDDSDDRAHQAAAEDQRP